MARPAGVEASDSILSTFTAGDGDNLAVQYWPVPTGVARRGVAVLVHGLGEHAGRHERLARRLNNWGFAVHGYDQCGHGESGGARGRLPSTMRLIDDLADIVDSARRRVRPGEPLILFGHSMGALVACCLMLLRPVKLDGLVLSAPAFVPQLSWFQRLLLRVVPRFAPNFTVRHGVTPEALSHDIDVVEAYRRDPLVHNRVSARLANFIAQAGPRILARAKYWKLPTLVLWGTSDLVVDTRACRAFVQAAPPEVVTGQGFQDLYHEVFNEAEAEPVYEALREWLDARLAASARAAPVTARVATPPLRGHPTNVREAVASDPFTPARPG